MKKENKKNKYFKTSLKEKDVKAIKKVMGDDCCLKCKGTRTLKDENIFDLSKEKNNNYKKNKK